MIPELRDHQSCIYKNPLGGLLIQVWLYIQFRAHPKSLRMGDVFHAAVRKKFVLILNFSTFCTHLDLSQHNTGRTVMQIRKTFT